MEKIVCKLKQLAFFYAVDTVEKNIDGCLDADVEIFDGPDGPSVIAELDGSDVELLDEQWAPDIEQAEELRKWLESDEAKWLI